ncbi:MAG: ABC transporter permease [Myxococcota bacterium]|nr:ABC transporter permease [Deltaproteobacteria bacterium]MDQ3339869.1 ABC transporter permease [Myxococcota bacterium]
MSLLTTFKLALRALWRNKVRTILTMLGIIFGIGAVIAMVASGEGAQMAVKQVFARMGTNVLIVTNQSTRGMAPSQGGGGGATLTWEDLAALQSGEISTIKYVAPALETRVQVVSEDADWNTRAMGTTSIWFKIRNWDAIEGAVFDEDTGNGTAKVAVIGKTVAAQLFPGATTAVGQVARINGQPYEIVGVLAGKGQGPMGDLDDLIVVPIKTYQQKIDRGIAKYLRGQVLITMTSDDVAERTISSITALLRDRHKLDSSDEDDFRIRNPTEFAKAQQASTQRIATLLAIVAAVSLFVGGIGVMNIMLVSVIERTREIGIRMAVGAKPRDVRLQFLVESIVISIVGGLHGILLGYFGAKYMAGYFGWEMIFPKETAILAFVVSGIVGIVFGMYPALRASRLDPITALRYES